MATIPVDDVAERFNKLGDLALAKGDIKTAQQCYKDAVTALTNGGNGDGRHGAATIADLVRAAGTPGQAGTGDDRGAGTTDTDTESLEGPDDQGWDPDDEP